MCFFNIKIPIAWIVVEEMWKMGRKQQCPQCGSKKFVIKANEKKCKVCNFSWAGRGSGKTYKKEKVRF